MQGYGTLTNSVQAESYLTASNTLNIVDLLAQMAYMASYMTCLSNKPS